MILTCLTRTYGTDITHMLTQCRNQNWLKNEINEINEIADHKRKNREHQRYRLHR